jgi:hypothetical protein
MLRRAFTLVAVLGCLAMAPLAAQEQQAAPVSPAPQEHASGGGGPRLTPDYPRYQPAVDQQNSLATTAAADRVTITITTLGLVLLIILLVLLIA